MNDRVSVTELAYELNRLSVTSWLHDVTVSRFNLVDIGRVFFYHQLLVGKTTSIQTQGVEQILKITKTILHR